MKRILILILLVTSAGTLYGAPSPTPVGYKTPTPAPTPSPSPVPGVIPDWAGVEIPVNLYYYFVGAVTDAPFVNKRNGQSFTVPEKRRFYVTDVNWSCESDVIGTIEWNNPVTDVIIDRVYFPFSGQGKVLEYVTPQESLDAGISPAITTDRDSLGIVHINGYLK